MLPTIFKYELKQLWRSKGMMLAVIIFTAIGFFALQQGKSIYVFQQTAIAKTNKYVAKNDSVVRAIFDTMQQATAKRTDSDVEAPFMLEWKLQAAAVKNISPLSILSIGQSDIYTPLMSIHFNRPVFKNEYTEFQNPEKLLAGNLDSSFFVLFLFPLLLIALSYNVQSADKETGIFPLLQAQAVSVNKIMQQRLLFRWLLALLPVAIICGASFVMLSSLQNFSVTEFLQWWAIALVYAVFWWVLVALVQRFQLSSLINAISLAGLWVLLLIAIPGLLNTWFNYKYPATNKLELTEYRDFDFKAWDKPLATHKQIITAQFPKINVEDKKIDTNDMKAFGYFLQVMAKEKALHNSFIQQSELQANAEEKTFWINPVGGVMRSFSTLSNSTLQQQQAFEKAILKVRELKGNYLFENQLTKSHFTKNDFEAMPKFNETEKAKYFFSYLLPLILLIGLFSVSLFIKRKNNEV